MLEDLAEAAVEGAAEGAASSMFRGGGGFIAAIPIFVFVLAISQCSEPIPTKVDIGPKKSITTEAGEGAGNFVNTTIDTIVQGHRERKAEKERLKEEERLRKEEEKRLAKEEKERQKALAGPTKWDKFKDKVKSAFKKED